MFNSEKKRVFLCDCYKFLAHDKWEREKNSFWAVDLSFFLMTYSMEIKIIQYSWVVVSFKLMFHGGK